MHRVDADAVAERCAFHRDRLGEQPHATLGRAIAGMPGPATQPPCLVPHGCRKPPPPPAFLIRAATSGPFKSSTSVTMTDAPSRASNSETASPMPDAPPVTKATLP